MAGTSFRLVLCDERIAAVDYSIHMNIIQGAKRGIEKPFTFRARVKSLRLVPKPLYLPKSMAKIGGSNLCPGVNDAGLEYLSELSGLKSLCVNGAKVTDRGIDAIAKLRRLRSLMLPTDCRMTDRGLARLGELPDLIDLSLPSCSGFLRGLLKGGGITRKGLERFR
jgi:hypothetical protein